MTRGDQKCPCGCHWNWGWLTSVFTDGISVGDIDQWYMVERNGAMLFIEAKKENEELPRGQRLTHIELSKKPGCESMIVYGPRSQPRFVDVYRGGWCVEVSKPTSQEDFRARVADWFKRANGLKEKIA